MLTAEWPHLLVQLVPVGDERWRLKKLRNYQEPLVAGVVADLTPRPRAVREVVLAACPGAGKTLMSIDAIARLLASGAVRRALVLAHGTTILRSQYAGALAEAAPPFTWATFMPKSDHGHVPLAKLKSQLVVALPQSLGGQPLRGFDLIMVDEAHQFYGEKMVTDIIARSGAKRVLLLTGTPSPFVARGLPIHAVTMQEIFRAGREAPDGPYIADARVVLLQSKYDVRRSQYNQDGEIKRAVRFTRNQTEETLADLLRSFPRSEFHAAVARLAPEALRVLKRMRHPRAAEYSRRAEEPASWAQELARTGKTMLVCRSQKIAQQAARYFARASVSVALSTSDTDEGGGEIERFQKDPAVQLLIVVCRASLGFDFPQLGALIDMTGTINIDRIFQMFARVVRPNGAAPKFFIKLASADMHRYTRSILKAALLLSGRAFYETWNGKDLNGVRVPVEPDETEEREGGAARGEPPAGRRRLPKIDEGFLAFEEFIEQADSLAFTTMGRVAAACGRFVVDPDSARREVLEFYARNAKPIPSGHRLYYAQMNRVCPGRDMFDKEVRHAAESVGYKGRTPVDFSGRTFGALVVLGRHSPSSWDCQCACGNRTIANTGHLSQGRRKSCGCRATNRGERHHGSVLKDVDVDRAVKRLLSGELSPPDLARELGVSSTVIYKRVLAGYAKALTCRKCGRRLRSYHFSRVRSPNGATNNVHLACVSADDTILAESTRNNRLSLNGRSTA